MTQRETTTSPATDFETGLSALYADRARAKHDSILPLHYRAPTSEAAIMASQEGGRRLQALNTQMVDVVVAELINSREGLTPQAVLESVSRLARSQRGDSFDGIRGLINSED